MLFFGGVKLTPVCQLMFQAAKTSPPTHIYIYSWLVLRFLNHARTRSKNTNHPKKTEPTGDGSEILKPVDKYSSLSPYLQGFTHIPGGAAFRPSTVCRLFERFMQIRAKWWSQLIQYQSTWYDITLCRPDKFDRKKVFTTLLKSEECFILESHSSNKKSHNHPNDSVTCSITCFLSFWGPAHFEGVC